MVRQVVPPGCGHTSPTCWQSPSTTQTARPKKPEAAVPRHPASKAIPLYNPVPA